MTVLLDVTHKQIGQLCREWYAIVDVIDVRSSAAFRQHADGEWAPLPARIGEPCGAVGSRRFGVAFGSRCQTHDAAWGA